MVDAVAALDAAAAARGKERALLLGRAVALYTGELLPGYHDLWIVTERAAFAERYFAALPEWLAHLAQTVAMEPAIEAVTSALGDLVDSEGKLDAPMAAHVLTAFA